jgi:hypothetical protein
MNSENEAVDCLFLPFANALSECLSDITARKFIICYNGAQPAGALTLAVILPGHVANHSPLSSAEIKNLETSPCVFMA